MTGKKAPGICAPVLQRMQLCLPFVYKQILEYTPEWRNSVLERGTPIISFTIIYN